MLETNLKTKSIAVLIPCHNEQKTIGKVIDDFRSQLPHAVVYVIDNCSIDYSADIAMQHGARIINEPRRGKGYVVEKMFDAVDTDIIIMVDGDDTYPSDSVHQLIQPLIEGQADMTVGARLHQANKESFPKFHIVGNLIVRKIVNWARDTDLTDIMSGYRAFNRRVVETIPTVSSGFEIETEITIQMLYYRRKILEIPISYSPRRDGSTSKINTFRDGFRVLWKIFTLLRAIKPLTFFGGVGVFFLCVSAIMGFSLWQNSPVNPGESYKHFSTIVVSAFFALISLCCFFLGILLNAINWRFIELHNILTRSHYTQRCTCKDNIKVG